ncbi:hypothetical protein ES703_109639 [subsurface metagenome]
MNYLEVVGPAFLGNIPMLLAWLVGIVLAVLMLRRGGGKAEKLLLAGCSLMFLAVIVRPFLTGLALWLVAEHGMTRASAIGLTFSLPNTILSMAGIVCLILAFWFRWKTKAAT